MKILVEDGNCELPRDARTLLKTPRTADVKDMDTGEFCHFPLKDSFEKRLAMSQFQTFKKVSLTINIDGVPIFKSTTFGLWLILGLINGIGDKGDVQIQTRPFVISVYGGVTKPRSSNEFMKLFVNEMLEIEQQGITVQNIKIKRGTLRWDSRFSMLLPDLFV